MICADREALLQQMNDSLSGVQYGQFEWRMSSQEITIVLDVLVMKKYSPWRDIVNQVVMRIVEGDLLGPSKHINMLLENKNPHK